MTPLPFRRPRSALHRKVLLTLALTAFAGCGQPGQDEQSSNAVESISSALTSGDVQINCGGPGVAPFVADTDFTNGAEKTRLNTIDLSKVVNPAPMAVYQSQRYASPYSYTIPGFAPGSYQLIRLHFAETNPVNNAPGKRLFSVAINGTTEISNLDLFATVGMNTAYIAQFTEAANSAGQYVLNFTASVDSATISGIEVLPVPSTTTVGTWTNGNPVPTGLSVFAQPQLLTDGSVLMGDGQSSRWFKLTPDGKGSYATGTWSQVASSNIARGFTPSAMLKNGKYLIEGGEYVAGGDPNGTPAVIPDHASVDIYDPIMNTWTAGPSLPGHNVSDAASSILPDGRFYSATQDSSTWTLNPYVTPMTWTQNTTAPIQTTGWQTGDEQAFTLMQNGKILDPWSVTAGAWVFDITANGGLGVWTATGAIGVSLTTYTQEIGPASLLYSGKVLQFGAASHKGANGAEQVDPGSTAIYDPTTNTWAVGASSPDANQWGDTSANVMINGHVMNETANATTSQPNSVANIYEYNPYQPNGGTFTKIAMKTADPTAQKTTLLDPNLHFPVFQQLPDGEVLVVDGPDTNSSGNSNIYLYMPAGGQSSVDPAWMPTMTSIGGPNSGSFTLYGKQLNGLTTGATFGDDRNSGSNYPIVWLTDASGDVFYARTHDFDQMTPRPNTAGSCQFTLPTTVPNGSYKVWVSASGVASSSSLPLTISGNHVASISGPSVGPGATATWTVTLSAPASTSTVVNLTTDNASVVTLGASSVTVPSGQKTATVTVTGKGFGVAHISAVTAIANAQFSAAMGTFGWVVDTLFNLGNAPSLFGPNVLSQGVVSELWEVTISQPAPAGGVPVPLTSSDINSFVVTSSVTIPAGATSATFPVSRGEGTGTSATITASLLNSSKSNLIAYTTTAPAFAQIQVTFGTGADDARADSELQLQVDNQTPVCLKPSNNAAPDSVCPNNGSGAKDQNGNQSWNNGSTDGPQTFSLSSSNISNMTVTLISHDSAFETDDNWDIQSVIVQGIVPNISSTTLLNIPAAAGGLTSSNCLARLKGSPNATTVTFSLNGANFHVYQNGTSSEVGETTTCTNNGG
jgi:hypothetical protein